MGTRESLLLQTRVPTLTQLQSIHHIAMMTNAPDLGSLLALRAFSRNSRSRHPSPRAPHIRMASLSACPQGLEGAIPWNDAPT